jgi:ATP-binding cassette subfamily B protein
VSQDVYIIDGTIADNIAYGTFQASRDEIIQAATMAQIHDFITELPKGYDTVLEEYGKKLSGGQRQRISIARALLKKSCLFIFDEATSALDNETESEINKAMDQLKRNHTVIIIAHRLSTVRNADTIFVIDNGVVTESGSHEELLAKSGSYAQLWNMQLQ